VRIISYNRPSVLRNQVLSERYTTPMNPVGFHGLCPWVNVKSRGGRQAKLDLLSATGYARGYLETCFWRIAKQSEFLCKILQCTKVSFVQYPLVLPCSCPSRSKKGIPRRAWIILGECGAPQGLGFREQIIEFSTV